MEILKTWNIRLLESITFNNPQQLNEISSVLNTGAMPSEGRKGKGKAATASKSFRASKQSSIKRGQDNLRRADSFSKYRTDIVGSAAATTITTTTGNRGLQGTTIKVGGLPPLPREANTRSWGGGDEIFGGLNGNLSQDSFFAHSTGLLRGSPPPLPPRPSQRRLRNFDGDESDDPDYAYIKEDELETPKTGASGNANTHKQKRPSISVDDVLKSLEQDIIRENRAKKEEEHRRRVRTLNRPRVCQNVPPLSLGPRVSFPPAITAVPQDYTDFVPSKQRQQIKSTSFEPPEKASLAVSHARSISDPDPRPHPSPSKALSQPPPVFEEGGAEGSGHHHAHLSDQIASDYTTFEPSSAPTLPPRTWRFTSTSSYNSMESPGNLGNELTASLPGSLSGSSIGTNAPANERGASLSGEGASPNSESAAGSNTGLLDKLIQSGSGNESSATKAANLTTPSFPSDKENKAPPTSIPEEIQTQQKQAGTTATKAQQRLSSSSYETTPPAPGQPPQRGAPTTPPPLPPRSPNKDKPQPSRKSSTSSSSSASSAATGRCPRCRSLRKTKTSISKTVSLDQRPASAVHTTTTASPDDCRKSLPDLADTTKALPENGLGGVRGQRHAHQRREHGNCSKCSPVSSTDALVGGGGESGGQPSLPSSSSNHQQNMEYLQLVGEEERADASPTPDTDAFEKELRQEMDILDSCLQTLEYLQHKVNSTSSSGDISVAMTSAVSSSTPSSAPSSSSPSSSSGLWMSTGGKAMQPDAKKSAFTQAKRETQLALAELNQPLTSFGPTLAVIKPHPSSSDIGKVSNGHTYHVGKQSSFSSLSTATSPSLSSSRVTNTSPSHGFGMRGGQLNGWATRPVSTGQLNVSLSQPQQQQQQQQRGATPTNLTGHAPPIPPRSMVSLNHSIAVATEPNQHHHQKSLTRSATQLHSQAPPTSGTVTNKRATYNRSISTSNINTHHAPLRNSSSFAVHHPHPAQTTPTMANHSRGHPTLTRPHQFNHVEAGQSSTVFIHHMKETRRVGGLTHLV